VKAMGSQPIRTAFRSPWQNGIAERWVGSVRRDLLDHVIVLNQQTPETVAELVHSLLQLRFILPHLAM
jgi:transposase InsO family protein